MRKTIMTASVMSLMIQGFSYQALANRMNDPDMPLAHCFHWLNERSARYLSFKYSHAQKNGGELTFYSTASTSNGSVAGPGLYCAKTPIGSYSYGDRVVRVEFVDDIVMEDYAGRKTCGTKGNFYSSQAECARRPTDVLLYNANSDWYVIKNPQAVKAWSANSDQLFADLNIAKTEAPGAATHFDMTMQAMSAEVQTLGKKIIFNSQARLGLEQVLKDQSQIDKIPILSLIDMIAAYTGDNISDKDKASLYITHFDRALKDKVLTFGDFANTLKNHPSLKIVLQSRIEKVNYAQIANYNPSTLIAAIDNLGMDIQAPQAEKLWQSALSSTSSLDSILQADLKRDGVFRKKFESSLPSAAVLAQDTKDHNLAPLIKILNDFVDPKSSLKSYAEALFEKVLKAGPNQNFDAIFDGIKNPALDKEQALANLIEKAQRTKFVGMDPLGTSLLFDKVRDQFNPGQQKSIESDIVSLPIKVDNNRLSFQYLEDYKNGKLVLPSFYPSKAFLFQLVDRSIRERSLGKNTTNTFRMILSGMFHYYAKLVNDAKDDKKANAMKKASEFFIELTEYLLRKNQLSYSYAALQNGLFFGADMQTKEHPIETAIQWYGNGDANLDQIIESAIKTSLDPSVIHFLSNTQEKGRGSDSQKAGKLLSLSLHYLASAEFKQRLKSPDFIAAQAERKAWANVVNSKFYSHNGRVYSDICAFFLGYDKGKGQMLSLHKDVNGGSIEAAKAIAQGDFCRKDNSNQQNP